MHGPDAPAPLTAEQVLSGRYRLVRPIARGGMADVWEGHDQVLSRDVAIKVLQRQYATDEVFLERFRREAVAAARLAHPGVVATFDAGLDGRTTYIVMELVRGQTLRQYLTDQGRLPPWMAVGIAGQIADALVVAHRAGIIHRDIKPANILLCEDTGPVPRVKVTDFGIAKAAERLGTDLTRTGMVLGTPRYLSPEQVQGVEPDARADLYALGVVTFEMLTGRSPFDGDTEMAMALARLNQPAPRVRSLRSDIPRSLDGLVADLLATKPDRRIPSAVALRQAIDGIMPSLPGPRGTRRGGAIAGGVGLPAPTSGRGRRFGGRRRDAGPPSASRNGAAPARPPAPAPRPGPGPDGGRGWSSPAGGNGAAVQPRSGAGSPSGWPAGVPAPGPGALPPRSTQGPHPAGPPPATVRDPFRGDRTPVDGAQRAAPGARSGSGTPVGTGSYGRSGPPGATRPYGGTGGPGGEPGRRGGATAGAPVARDVVTARTGGGDATDPGGAGAGRRPDASRRRRRRHRGPGLVVGAVVVVAVVVAALLLGRTHRTAGSGAPPAGAISIAAVSVWIEPPQTRPDNPGEVGNTFDGNPKTYWSTYRYYGRDFGGLGGEGLAIHLSATSTLHTLTVTSFTQGWAATTFVSGAYVAGGHSGALAGWGAPTATKTDIPGSTTFSLGGRRGSWVLLWMTDTGPALSLAINELQVS